MAINSDQKPREYASSKEEMNRRKKAFMNLSGSFFVSVCIFSLDFIKMVPHILVPTFIIVATILVILVLRANKTQDNQKKLRICISHNELIWKFKRSSDKCLLSDIRSIRIKRNIKGFIREIRIGIYGMKYLYINGLEDFEEFLNDLLDSTKGVKIKKFKEPVDFDHPLYYTFLGTTLGLLLTLFFRFVPSIGETNVQYVQVACAGFVIFTGLFLLINKPIRGRFGSKNLIADYISGSLALAAGVFIIFYSKIFW